jgi:hypothetical protein
MIHIIALYSDQKDKTACPIHETGLFWQRIFTNERSLVLSIIFLIDAVKKASYQVLRVTTLGDMIVMIVLILFQLIDKILARSTPAQ